MDGVLCDELLQEILQRLPPSSSPSVSLVSKRWLSLLRSSTSSLSLHLPFPPPPLPPTTLSIPTFLSHYPFLSSLTIIISVDDSHLSPPPSSSDLLLLSVASSPCHHRLSHLRFLPISPLSPSALLSSSSSLQHLTSLHLSSLRPLSLRWLSSFPSLKSLSLLNSPTNSSNHQEDVDDDDDDEAELPSDRSSALPLETLSLSGIRATDRGVAWLWRRCANLRWLQLRVCEGTGDGPSSPSFPLCLHGLLGLELRTCRTIADRVLLRAADHCRSLTSLLLYDGGGGDALRHFIRQLGTGLSSLDLRLPLDLHNDHLLAVATSCRLSALRLQSCCLVTDDGLRALAQNSAAVSRTIQELALINCDVLDREPGLLSFLAQSMRQLRRLDLSHNESLADKEVGAMLASCANLVELRLRGCRGLTDATMFAMVRCCGQCLEVVDVSRCPGISADGIEMFILSTFKLNRIIVEDDKVVSEAARALLSRKAIQIG